jgi:hypothetical protein
VVLDYYGISRSVVNKHLDTDKLASPKEKGSKLKKLFDLIRLAYPVKARYNLDGFLDMATPDQAHFDSAHYEFSPYHQEFIGALHTRVYDAAPRKKASGSFLGRIWVDDEGNLVRFNGVSTGNSDEKHPQYLHFDSWRAKSPKGEWLPNAIYVEDQIEKEQVKASVRFWAYGKNDGSGDSDNTSVVVENANDESEQAKDISPVQAFHDWESLAERNVIDRLTTAGIVAPASPFDAVLEQIANNIVIGTNLNLPFQVRCRLLLTTPIEATTAGSTILLSRGLVDSMPNEESLASIIAMELAHLEETHTINTRYSFSDRMEFDDDASFTGIRLQHSDADKTAAAKRGKELFMASIYSKKAATASLYYKQLAQNAPHLRQLIHPCIGDSLLTAQGIPWLAGLDGENQQLSKEEMIQNAPLPLGSNLVVDAWTDSVRMISAQRRFPTTIGEVRPFQISPLSFRFAPEQPSAPNNSPYEIAPQTAATNQPDETPKTE